MKDLFKKSHEPGGYFSVLREMRDRYFVMPKIEGSPGRVIRYAAVKLFRKSGECIT
jgi:hypothetical protein